MNPLDQLADIHLPAPIGFWPLAWGWWLLFGLVILVCSALIYWRYSFVKNYAYRKTALSEIQKLQSATSQDFIQSANKVLRRCALHQSNNTGALTGEHWLIWLDNQCKATNLAFSQGIGRLLLHGPYQPNTSFSEQERQALFDLIVRWIKRHRFVKEPLTHV